MFGGQGVVDVEGLVLLGRGLDGVLQLVLGVGVILHRWREGGVGRGVENRS